MQNLDLVKSTIETKQLYQELINLGVDAKIELYNGNFTVDIAIPSKKINIEIDGNHHFLQYDQAKADILRTFFAFKYGYFTLRIPNVMIRENLSETVLLVKKFIDEF